MRLYCAYGSNCNIKQMRYRCKDSIFVATGYINNYQLQFKGVATIVPKKSTKVPVVIWKISDKDEVILDIYEGLKNKLYRKELIKVYLDTKEIVEAMVYILNSNKIEYMPNIVYFESILDGYKDNNLPVKYLLQAYARSFNSEKKLIERSYKTSYQTK
jgi:hypothetical protein